MSIEITKGKNLVDETFHWKGFGECRSKCRIRIFPGIVIATELLGENTGTSITNDVEKLMRLVYEHYNLTPETTTWIEHYPPSDYPEEFSKVTVIQGEATRVFSRKKMLNY